MIVNVIMSTPVQNIEVNNSQQIDVVDTIAKYYNLISSIPISIVTKFLATKATEKITDASKTNSSKKESQKTNKVNDFDFIDNISLSQQSIQTHSLSVLFNKCTIQINNFKTSCILICSQVINKVLFTGSMALARGDTEENIYYNKYGKVYRLV